MASCRLALTLGDSFDSSCTKALAAEEMNHVLSWQDIDILVRDLTRQIAADGVPDVLLAIQRGGFVPAVMLSHQLRVRQLLILNVGRTISDSVHAKKGIPVVGPSSPLAMAQGKDVLIVDDVAGSGHTIRLARNSVLPIGATRVRCAVLAVNRQNWEAENQHPPFRDIEYIGREVTGWVIFPWELV
jgi:hypoxanthine phosphoribosyltransferase